MIWRRASLYTGVFIIVLALIAGCVPQTAIPNGLSAGVAITQEDMEALHEELVEKVTAAAPSVMTQPGLVGALGGARVKLLRTGSHQVLLPLPQLADGQVPISYYIRSKPRDATTEYRLQSRENANDVINVRLTGDRDQEVQIEWSAVILVAGKRITANPTDPESFRPSSSCVQAESDPIKELAEELWPDSGQVTDYAGNIQRFIREMKQTKPPRSLDALGILDSGASWICTANANLALSLLRSKGIASRSMAVIPPTSQRLEMHRIVEYFQDDQWLSFDPSSLHTDVPMSPWQSVIMAKTTMADENVAMKPRMGTSVGCPYGQELELLGNGITLWGQDFFWTLAKPLSTFQAEDEAISIATTQWNRYLQEGTLSPGQVQAFSATTSAEIQEFLKTD